MRLQFFLGREEVGRSNLYFKSLEEKYRSIVSIYEKVEVPPHMINQVYLANDYFTDMLQREIEWFERVIKLLQKDLMRKMEGK